MLDKLWTNARTTYKFEEYDKFRVKPAATFPSSSLYEKMEGVHEYFLSIGHLTGKENNMKNVPSLQRNDTASITSRIKHDYND